MMRRQQETSPLPPDPAGQEDIMSDEPRGEGAIRADDIRAEGEGSLMPPERAGTEDVLREDRPDPTVADG
jgi:hypothetical protein